MNKYKSHLKVKGLLPLFFLLAFSACKKESTEIGANLRGDNGDINSDKLEFKNILARTVAGDSFSTLNLGTHHIGVINDPEIGLRKATLTVQPRLSEFNANFDGANADSLFLVLKYDQVQQVGGALYSLYYGDSTSVVELEVYRLKDDLNRDSTYTQDFDPTLGDKVGEYSGKMNIYKTEIVVVNGDTFQKTPELIIPLDLSFGQELMELGDDAYSSNESFLNLMKGLVIVPKSNTVSGPGTIVAVEAFTDESGLLLHYGDSLTKSYPMTNESITVNSYETTSSATIEAQINGSGSFNRVYPQTMGGAKVRIEIPELNDFITNNKNVVINEAKLEIITVDGSKADGIYDSPVFLYLLVPDPDDSTRALSAFEDISTDPRFSFGEKDGDKYDIFFNRYLQYLINTFSETGDNEFDGFYLTIPRSSPAIPYRAILDTDPLAGNVKVSITYTKLN